MKEVVLRPIGVVRSPITEVSHTEWDDIVSEIWLDENLVPGLLGIEEYEYLTVVFYLDRASFSLPADLQRHPRDRIDMPVRGVFATRTQYRPNPVAVTRPRLLGVDGNVLTVQGLDALDGTPVLDIKPYLPEQASSL